MQDTLKLTAAQERELIRQLGWAEYMDYSAQVGVADLMELAEQYIAERAQIAAAKEVVVTVLQPKAKSAPLSMLERRKEFPDKLSGKVIQIEVVTQDFDDLHGTDEYHDVERKQRLYLASFNTVTKRVVFRTGDGKQIVGTAVTPGGNLIKSSEGDGIYTDKANGAQWMYVDVKWDGRESKQ